MDKITDPRANEIIKRLGGLDRRHPVVDRAAVECHAWKLQQLVRFEEEL